MTTLSIDELSGRLKRRWGWPASATNVPIGADSPLLTDLPPGDRNRRRPLTGRAAVPEWLKPKRGHAGPPGMAAFHGKASPSVG